MSQDLTPTMINEKTQLGKVVSVLKGLKRYFYAENEKSIFSSKISKPLAFTQEKVMKSNFEKQKSIFRPQRKSGVLTLLGAKQPCQVASFQLSLSGSKPDSF